MQILIFSLGTIFVLIGSLLTLEFSNIKMSSNVLADII